jgi:hypothetical protein
MSEANTTEVEHYKGEVRAAREFAELAAKRLTEGFDAVGRQAQRLEQRGGRHRRKGR